jgi:hypothetical protein
MSAFKLYRIVCAANGKALVSGSDCQTRVMDYPSLRLLPWYDRGCWSDSGAFWKREATVRRHLQNLCHDWINKSAPARYPRYPNQRVYWTEALPGPADWSRLALLRVEQIYVTKHTTTTLSASDFMGIPDAGASPSPPQVERASSREEPEQTQPPIKSREAS